MEKKKIIKKVLLVLFILLAIFLGIIIRRMIIIIDLNTKVSKYIDVDNHYEKIVTDYGESKTICEYYCKDENAAMFIETTTKQSSEKKKLIQYFKGNKANAYIEAGTTKIAMLNTNGIPSKILIWAIDYNDNLWNLFYLALITPIKTIEYNGKECYFLDSLELRHSFIEKDTGLVLRAIDGEYENGYMVEYEYSFDNIDDSIFIEPDISQYEIKENN